MTAEQTSALDDAAQGLIELIAVLSSIADGIHESDLQTHDAIYGAVRLARPIKTSIEGLIA